MCDVVRVQCSRDSNKCSVVVVVCYDDDGSGGCYVGHSCGSVVKFKFKSCSGSIKRTYIRIYDEVND